MGKRDSRDFLACLEIHDHEPVEVANLHEQQVGRAVGVLRHRHRTDAFAKLDVPRRDIGHRIEDAHVSLAARLARDHVLAVGRDIEVVHGALGPDALDLGERCGIDHIRDARVVADRLPDPHIHFPPVRGDGDVVRTPRERNSLDELSRRHVGNVERVVGLAADVDAGSVRGCHDAVGRFDVRDLSDDGVGGGIDDVNSVAGGVALEDAHLVLGQQRQRKTDHRQRRQTATNVMHSHRQVLTKNRSNPGHSAPSPHAPVNSTSFSLAFRPHTQLASVCHSGSRNEFQCLPPLW